MNEIKKGALLSYITILIVNLSGLILTPIIIKNLGNAEYGLYVLIGSIAGYLGVMDFGLNNAVIRYVAMCNAEGNREKEGKFLGAAVVVNILVSLFIVALGCIFYANLGTLFNDSLTPSEIEKAKLMLALLIINVVLTITGSMFAAICAGHERFVYPRLINITRYVIRFILILSLFALGGKAISIVVVDTLLALFVFIANGVYAIRALHTKFDISSLNVRLVKEVFSYSAWIFLFAMISQFQWQTGQVVIGSAMDPVSVAVYAVGIMLGTYYGAFSTAISALFVSRATRMTFNNSSAEGLTDEMIKIGRISLLVLLLILGGFLLFGQQFIFLWVGPDYAQSWIVASVIMLVYTLPLVQSFGNQILEARGMFSFKAKTYFISLPIGVLVGYLLLNRLGILGMAIGIAAGWLAALVIMNFYYITFIKLDIGRFFKELLIGTAPAFVVAMLIGLAINKIPGSDWFNLSMKIPLFTVAYAMLMYRFGMRDSEKDMLRSIVVSVNLPRRQI